MQVRPPYCSQRPVLQPKGVAKRNHWGYIESTIIASISVSHLNMLPDPENSHSVRWDLIMFSLQMTQNLNFDPVEEKKN